MLLLVGGSGDSNVSLVKRWSFFFLSSFFFSRISIRLERVLRRFGASSPLKGMAGEPSERRRKLNARYKKRRVHGAWGVRQPGGPVWPHLNRLSRSPRPSCSNSKKERGPRGSPRGEHGRALSGNRMEEACRRRGSGSAPSSESKNRYGSSRASVAAAAGAAAEPLSCGTPVSTSRVRFTFAVPGGTLSIRLRLRLF